MADTTIAEDSGTGNLGSSDDAAISELAALREELEGVADSALKANTECGKGLFKQEDLTKQVGLIVNITEKIGSIGEKLSGKSGGDITDILGILRVTKGLNDSLRQAATLADKAVILQAVFKGIADTARQAASNFRPTAAQAPAPAPVAQTRQNATVRTQQQQVQPDRPVVVKHTNILPNTSDVKKELGVITKTIEKENDNFVLEFVTEESLKRQVSLISDFFSRVDEIGMKADQAVGKEGSDILDVVGMFSPMGGLSEKLAELKNLEDRAKHVKFVLSSIAKNVASKNAAINNIQNTDTPATPKSASPAQQAHQPVAEVNHPAKKIEDKETASIQKLEELRQKYAALTDEIKDYQDSADKGFDTESYDENMDILEKLQNRISDIRTEAIKAKASAEQLAEIDSVKKGIGEGRELITKTVNTHTPEILSSVLPLLFSTLYKELQQQIAASAKTFPTAPAVRAKRDQGEGQQHGGGASAADDGLVAVPGAVADLLGSANESVVDAIEDGVRQSLTDTHKPVVEDSLIRQIQENAENVVDGGLQDLIQAIDEGAKGVKGVSYKNTNQRAGIDEAFRKTVVLKDSSGGGGMEFSYKVAAETALGVREGGDLHSSNLVKGMLGAEGARAGSSPFSVHLAKDKDDPSKADVRFFREGEFSANQNAVMNMEDGPGKELFRTRMGQIRSQHVETRIQEENLREKFGKVVEKPKDQEEHQLQIMERTQQNKEVVRGLFSDPSANMSGILDQLGLDGIRKLLRTFTEGVSDSAILGIPEKGSDGTSSKGTMEEFTPGDRLIMMRLAGELLLRQRTLKNVVKSNTTPEAIEEIASGKASPYRRRGVTESRREEEADIRAEHMKMTVDPLMEAFEMLTKEIRDTRDAVQEFGDMFRKMSTEFGALIKDLRDTVAAVAQGKTPEPAEVRLSNPVKGFGQDAVTTSGKVIGPTSTAQAKPVTTAVSGPVAGSAGTITIAKGNVVVQGSGQYGPMAMGSSSFNPVMGDASGSGDPTMGHAEPASGAPEKKSIREILAEALKAGKERITAENAGTVPPAAAMLGGVRVPKFIEAMGIAPTDLPFWQGPPDSTGRPGPYVNKNNEQISLSSKEAQEKLISTLLDKRFFEANVLPQYSKGIKEGSSKKYDLGGKEGVVLISKAEDGSLTYTHKKGDSSETVDTAKAAILLSKSLREGYAELRKSFEVVGPSTHHETFTRNANTYSRDYAVSPEDRKLMVENNPGKVFALEFISTVMSDIEAERAAERGLGVRTSYTHATPRQAPYVLSEKGKETYYSERALKSQAELDSVKENAEKRRDRIESEENQRVREASGFVESEALAPNVPGFSRKFVISTKKGPKQKFEGDTIAEALKKVEKFERDLQSFAAITNEINAGMEDYKKAQSELKKLGENLESAGKSVTEAEDMIKLAVKKDATVDEQSRVKAYKDAIPDNVNLDEHLANLKKAQTLAKAKNTRAQNVVATQEDLIKRRMEIAKLAPYNLDPEDRTALNAKGGLDTKYYEHSVEYGIADPSQMRSALLGRGAGTDHESRLVSALSSPVDGGPTQNVSKEHYLLRLQQAREAAAEEANNARNPGRAQRQIGRMPEQLGLLQGRVEDSSKTYFDSLKLYLQKKVEAPKKEQSANFLSALTSMFEGRAKDASKKIRKEDLPEEFQSFVRQVDEDGGAITLEDGSASGWSVTGDVGKVLEVLRYNRDSARKMALRHNADVKNAESTKNQARKALHKTLKEAKESALTLYEGRDKYEDTTFQTFVQEIDDTVGKIGSPRMGDLSEAETTALNSNKADSAMNAYLGRTPSRRVQEGKRLVGKDRARGLRVQELVRPLADLSDELKKKQEDLATLDARWKTRKDREELLDSKGSSRNADETKELQAIRGEMLRGPRSVEMARQELIVEIDRLKSRMDENLPPAVTRVDAPLPPDISKGSGSKRVIAFSPYDDSREEPSGRGVRKVRGAKEKRDYSKALTQEEMDARKARYRVVSESDAAKMGATLRQSQKDSERQRLREKAEQADLLTAPQKPVRATYDGTEDRKLRVQDTTTRASNLESVFTSVIAHDTVDGKTVDSVINDANDRRNKLREGLALVRKNLSDSNRRLKEASRKLPKNASAEDRAKQVEAKKAAEQDVLRATAEYSAKEDELRAKLFSGMPTDEQGTMAVAKSVRRKEGKLRREAGYVTTDINQAKAAASTKGTPLPEGVAIAKRTRGAAESGAAKVESAFEKSDRALRERERALKAAQNATKDFERRAQEARDRQQEDIDNILNSPNKYESQAHQDAALLKVVENIENLDKLFTESRREAHVLEAGGKRTTDTPDSEVLAPLSALRDARERDAAELAAANKERESAIRLQQNSKRVAAKDAKKRSSSSSAGALSTAAGNPAYDRLDQLLREFSGNENMGSDVWAEIQKEANRKKELEKAVREGMKFDKQSYGDRYGVSYEEVAKQLGEKATDEDIINVVVKRIMAKVKNVYKLLTDSATKNPFSGFSAIKTAAMGKFKELLQSGEAGSMNALLGAFTEKAKANGPLDPASTFGQLAGKKVLSPEELLGIPEEKRARANQDNEQLKDSIRAALEGSLSDMFNALNVGDMQGLKDLIRELSKQGTHEAEDLGNAVYEMFKRISAAAINPVMAHTKGFQGAGGLMQSTSEAAQSIRSTQGKVPAGVLKAMARDEDVMAFINPALQRKETRGLTGAARALAIEHNRKIDVEITRNLKFIFESLYTGDSQYYDALREYKERRRKEFDKLVSESGKERDLDKISEFMRIKASKEGQSDVSKVISANANKGVDNMTKSAMSDLRKASSGIVGDLARAAQWMGMYRGMYELGTAIRNMVRTMTVGGVQYLMQQEQQTLGLKGIIAANYEIANAQGKTVQGMEKFTLAGRAAEAEWRRLQVASFDVVGTSEDLMEVYNAIIPRVSYLGGGLEDALYLTKGASLAASAMGVSFKLARNSLTSLLNGNVRLSNSFTASLGITESQVRMYEAEGTLIEEIKERLKPYVRLQLEANNLLQARLETMKELMGYSGSKMMAPATSWIKETIKEIQGKFGSTDPVTLQFKFTDNAEAYFSKLGSMGASLLPAMDELKKLFFDIARTGVPAFLSFMREFSGTVTKVASGIATVGKASMVFLSRRAELVETVVQWGLLYKVMMPLSKLMWAMAVSTSPSLFKAVSGNAEKWATFSKENGSGIASRFAFYKSQIAEKGKELQKSYTEAITYKENSSKLSGGATAPATGMFSSIKQSVSNTITSMASLFGILRSGGEKAGDGAAAGISKMSKALEAAKVAGKALGSALSLIGAPMLYTAIVVGLGYAIDKLVDAYQWAKKLDESLNRPKKIVIDTKNLPETYRKILGLVDATSADVANAHAQERSPSEILSMLQANYKGIAAFIRDNPLGNVSSKAFGSFGDYASAQAEHKELGRRKSSGSVLSDIEEARLKALDAALNKRALETMVTMMNRGIVESIIPDYQRAQASSSALQTAMEERNKKLTADLGVIFKEPRERTEALNREIASRAMRNVSRGYAGSEEEQDRVKAEREQDRKATQAYKDSVRPDLNRQFGAPEGSTVNQLETFLRDNKARADASEDAARVAASEKVETTKQFLDVLGASVSTFKNLVATTKESGADKAKNNPDLMVVGTPDFSHVIDIPPDPNLPSGTEIVNDLERAAQAAAESLEKLRRGLSPAIQGPAARTTEEAAKVIAREIAVNIKAVETQAAKNQADLDKKNEAVMRAREMGQVPDNAYVGWVAKYAAETFKIQHIQLTALQKLEENREKLPDDGENTQFIYEAQKRMLDLQLKTHEGRLKLEAQITAEVHKRMVDFMAAAKELKATLIQNAKVPAAEARVAVAQAKYDANYGSLQEVRDAEDALQKAKFDTELAKYQMEFDALRKKYDGNLDMVNRVEGAYGGFGSRTKKLYPDMPGNMMTFEGSSKTSTVTPFSVDDLVFGPSKKKPIDLTDPAIKDKVAASVSPEEQTLRSALAAFMKSMVAADTSRRIQREAFDKEKSLNESRAVVDYEYEKKLTELEQFNKDFTRLNELNALSANDVLEIELQRLENQKAIVEEQIREIEARALLIQGDEKRRSEWLAFIKQADDLKNKVNDIGFAMEGMKLPGLLFKNTMGQMSNAFQSMPQFGSLGGQSLSGTLGNLWGQGQKAGGAWGTLTAQFGNLNAKRQDLGRKKIFDSAWEVVSGNGPGMSKKESSKATEEATSKGVMGGFKQMFSIKGNGGGIQGVMGVLGNVANAAGAAGSIVQMGMQVFGIFKSIFTSAARKIAARISKDVETIQKAYNDGSSNLAQTISALEAQRTSAITELSGKKGGKEQLDKLLPGLDDAINGLKKQQREIFRSFEERLAILREPKGAQQVAQSVMELAKSVKDYVDAGGDAAKANEFWVKSLQNLKDEYQQGLANAEKEAIDNAIQLNDLIEQRADVVKKYNEEELKIRGKGSLERQLPTIVQAGKELAELRKNRDKELRDLDSQISVLTARVEGEREIFGMSKDIDTLRKRSIALQIDSNNIILRQLKEQMAVWNNGMDSYFTKYQKFIKDLYTNPVTTPLPGSTGTKNPDDNTGTGYGGYVDGTLQSLQSGAYSNVQNLNRNITPIQTQSVKNSTVTFNLESINIVSNTNNPKTLAREFGSYLITEVDDKLRRRGLY